MWFSIQRPIQPTTNILIPLLFCLTLICSRRRRQLFFPSLFRFHDEMHGLIAHFFLFLLLHIFMKLTKLVWHFSDFSMIFWWILQDLCFYRKRKKRKKRKKACMGLVRPTAKPAQLQGFNPGWKKKPTFFWFFYEFLVNFARSLFL